MRSRISSAAHQSGRRGTSVSCIIQTTYEVFVPLVDKDPDRAISLFWTAVNVGDRVDSALKDMAIVMKQQNRPQEAIEAIKSLRNRCSDEAQESLDNVLLGLYKRCGRLDDQIDVLTHKLHLVHQGIVKRSKTARSQGKKFQVLISQEASSILVGHQHLSIGPLRAKHDSMDGLSIG
ncbi:protein POLLENLESS 3-LIKE 2-like isoform X2 [Physcomitrium patens]|uniref:protein POLLENLESS 3-LIKE 2-like isoform X2 n=1 Tax=Physcomitrium patens TaxID=3218 RepID=UPI003CCC9305